MSAIEKLIKGLGLNPQEMQQKADETTAAMVSMDARSAILLAHAEAQRNYSLAMTNCINDLLSGQIQLNQNMQVLLNAIKELKQTVEIGQQNILHLLSLGVDQRQPGGIYGAKTEDEINEQTDFRGSKPPGGGIDALQHGGDRDGDGAGDGKPECALAVPDDKPWHGTGGIKPC